MAREDNTLQFPRIVDNGDGTATFTLGKISWKEQTDEPLLDVSSIEEALKTHARMWCIQRGILTLQELLDSTPDLAAYHARNENIKVDIL